MSEEFLYTDEKGVSWDTYKDYVFMGLLGFCGCYDGELFEDIFKVLLAYDTEKFVYYDALLPKNSRKYVELILHCLTGADLLEHGTAVRGSWLTEKGKEICKKIKTLSP